MKIGLKGRFSQNGNGSTPFALLTVKLRGRAQVNEMSWKSYGRKIIPVENLLKIVRKCLELNKECSGVFDDTFLSYMLKEPLESGTVYISKAAYNMLEQYDSQDSGLELKARELAGKLKGGKVAPAEQNEDRMKLIIESDITGLRSSAGVVWEHMIPVKVQIEILKAAYEKNTLNETLESLRAVTHVAIITKLQDHKLNEATFRQQMPDGSLDITAICNNPFVRYDKAGIELMTKD